MIPYLSSPNVFACHCESANGLLTVGILALNDDFEPGLHRLYDEAGQLYQVQIPAIALQVSYKTILPIISAPDDCA
jgi:hypothetical protein